MRRSCSIGCMTARKLNCTGQHVSLQYNLHIMRLSEVQNKTHPTNSSHKDYWKVKNLQIMVMRKSERVRTSTATEDYTASLPLLNKYLTPFSSIGDAWCTKDHHKNMSSGRTTSDRWHSAIHRPLCLVYFYGHQLLDQT